MTAFEEMYSMGVRITEETSTRQDKNYNTDNTKENIVDCKITKEKTTKRMTGKERLEEMGRKIEENFKKSLASDNFVMDDFSFMRAATPILFEESLRIYDEIMES